MVNFGHCMLERLKTSTEKVQFRFDLKSGDVRVEGVEKGKDTEKEDYREIVGEE